MELVLLLAIPLTGALLLAVVGGRRRAPELNVVLSAGTFVAAGALTARVIAEGSLLRGREQFFIDPFNVFLIALTAFVGLTTALFSRPYMRVEMDHGRITAGRLRLYHSMYQLFMATMLVALTTNNMGLLWVAMEAATLSTVLLVTLYRTPASLEAGWKYFILCGVGIAQALFGTILLYFAAEKVLGAEGVTALLWTHLDAVKTQLEPTVLELAFVFLLVGYGTKVGLAPLHNWLPDAHAEGPTPISAVLSGLLLNVAIYAVVRCKVLVEGSLQSSFPSQMLMGFGVVSVVIAAFLLWRQRDIKRLFAYSSIEHMGIITFAFGMGGAVASFAALLHMTVHSLTKSAIFFVVGHAAQKAGSQLMDDIRGLITHQPDDRLGAYVRNARDPRRAAVRRIRQRVPDTDDRDAGTAMGDAHPARLAGRRVCSDFRPRTANGVRRDECSGACRTRPRCSLCSRTWRWCCCSVSMCRRTLPTGTVPRRGSSEGPEMSSRRWWDRAERLGGVLPARRLTATDGPSWQQCAADVAAAGDCLLALWSVDDVSGADAACVPHSRSNRAC